MFALNTSIDESSMNLFAQFEELLNPEVIAKIAVYVDEPVEKTRKAVQGLVYTVVGGLIKRITSEIGINQLALQIQRGHYEGQLVAQLPTLFKDPTQVNATITAGNDAISHLLPALKSSIAGMITSYAGIRNSSAISLLGLTTALVLDELGRQMRDRKLDADGLAATLFEQREPLLNAVPETLMPQLTEKLGLQPIFGGLSTPARRTTVVAAPGRTVAAAVAPAPTFVQDSDENDSNGLVKWGVGALLVAALAGGYFVWQNRQKPTSPTQQTSDIEALPTDSINADTVARSLAVPQDTTARPAATVPPATTAVTTPVASSMLTGGSPAARLNLYLNDPTTIKGRLFPLPTVNFQPGTIVLTPASEATVTELINVLKTHPTTQIRLIGYANDASVGGSGLTNKALSFKRVNILKQQLVSAGINYVRVDAVGLGTGVTPPKPGDSTAVRKPPMRKIDMRVVVK